MKGVLRRRPRLPLGSTAKSMKTSNLIIAADRIERRIVYLRGVKVILSSDLAELMEWR